MTCPACPFKGCDGCRFQGGAESKVRANPCRAKGDNVPLTCENGTGKDERPVAPTADRSSHSDSLQEPGGMAQW